MNFKRTVIKELVKLSKAFPDIIVSNDLRFILIPKFGPLPPQYNTKYTRLLIELPNPSTSGWEYIEPKAYLDSRVKIVVNGVELESIHLARALTPTEIQRWGFVYCCMRLNRWNWREMSLLDFISLLVEWLEGLEE